MLQNLDSKLLRWIWIKFLSRKIFLSEAYVQTLQKRVKLTLKTRNGISIENCLWLKILNQNKSLDVIVNYCYIFCRSVDYFLHQNIFPKWKSCKGASIFSCCGGEDLCGSRHYLDKIDKSKRKRLKKKPSSIVDNLSLYLLFWLRKVSLFRIYLCMCLTCHF